MCSQSYSLWIYSAKKFRRTDGFDTKRFSQVQQVFVAGDNIFCGRSQGSGQINVVFRIATPPPAQRRRFDHLGPGFHPDKFRMRVCLCPAVLPPVFQESPIRIRPEWHRWQRETRAEAKCRRINHQLCVDRHGGDGTVRADLQELRPRALNFSASRSPTKAAQPTTINFPASHRSLSRRSGTKTEAV